ncbi:UDP-N-acetylmuramoyl-tripeptide--D-alanyl-D-alanine ligase [Pseudomarimonas arenosa]|uniref:UDP-N-acetylmuramoyl-tripeptide--D-alanyl-D-alanine ligase n=1 Tax=Pseudomarimonas arenosa TaxID=2774145 RepID=A0AAW3ZH83_9GAMM|nr:UDP-N-acetylmuramoyl-tripeptide--D-alanyl-D-alanine ligase [Pseudomarimonas arenosa]MBD8525453.1 UDP-N-acetylmuramoyl-tripeptide--D-alanyl-D-alanine ligase [Pseudomarimonas arenosa]
MKPTTLSTIAEWLGLPPPLEAREIRGVVADSRRVTPGDLFVALSGERVDGHDFVERARQQGAQAALVAHPVESPLPQLIVDSPLLAIGRIARQVAAQRRTRVLALTGSNGKTTVKTLLHAILLRVAPAYCNPGNHNNELGMPLALIAQPEDAEFAVYEMGAGQPGDIEYLADIALPEVALVNNIGPAHLERMGSLLGIADTKGAIYQALQPGGVAVLNADDAFAPWFESEKLHDGVKTLRFALQANAPFRAQAIELAEFSSRFLLQTPAGAAKVELPLPGRHNVSNALAAAAMAHAVGAPLAAIVEGLCSSQPVAGRQQSFALPAGGRLIDDSYNANPASVAAAIDRLAGHGGSRWLVLGDMRELGPDSRELHRGVGERAKRAGIEHLWVVGDDMLAAAEAFGQGARHFAEQAVLIETLRSALPADAVVLVKGSRGSRMERVVDALLGRGEDGHAA